MRMLRTPGTLQSPAAPSPRGSRPTRWLLLIAALLVVAGMLILSACGSSTSSSNQGDGYHTPTVSGGSTVTPGVTATPGVQAYAYLYSRVDYPLQIPVDSGDVVTLTLSPRSSILTVTPAPGSGATTVGGPIPLPTDVRDYQDIGAAVDTQSANSGATSPVVWQLTSAPRQSLLTPAATGAARGYLDSVVFTWHVQAVAAGQNLIQITLHLYYVYLDGSEHDGSISMTQTPIPMVAADATPLNTTLPPFRLPVAGLTWLAGIIAAIRFIWGAFHTLHDIADPVKDMAEAAKTIHARIAGTGEQSASQSQQPVYPNPWTQRPHSPAGYPAHPQPPAVPGALGAPGAPGTPGTRQPPSRPPLPAPGPPPAPGQPTPNSQRLWPPGP